MTDIFLYSGELTPNNIKLSDPTVLRSGGATTFSYSMSGGITFAGHAPESIIRTYAVSGGLSYGGVGTYNRTWQYAVSGGIVFGGADTQKRTWQYAVSGGITFAGRALEKITRVYPIISGGITFGGSVVEEIIRVFPIVSSGILFGGAGTTSFTSAGPTEFVYEGSGGIVFGGVAVSTPPVFVSEEDSRRWFQRRFNAPTVIRGFEIKRPGISSPVITADALVPVQLIRLSMSVGAVRIYTDVSIAAAPKVEPIQIQTALASVQVSAESQSSIQSIGMSVSMDQIISVSTDATAPILPFRVRTRINRVTVAIGPDLIKQDDEELLFLLEVA